MKIQQVTKVHSAILHHRYRSSERFQSGRHQTRSKVDRKGVTG